MIFGVCCGNEPENIKAVKDAGFDYVEYNFCALVNLSDEEFAQYKETLSKNDITCYAANCFLPGEFQVSGDDLDEKAVIAYLEKGMQRGSQIGLKKVAFGSGKSRNLPQNQPYSKGFMRLSSFLKNIVVPLAQKYGITVVIEPLRIEETNIINTVKEGAILAATTQSENIACLADIYHMVSGNDSFDNIKDLKGILKHAHISLPVIDENGSKRVFPTDPNEYDYKSFIDALIYAECDTCSIEASCTDFLKEVPVAYKALTSI